MKSVMIYCEGETEEAFVNKILKKAFAPLEVYLKPFLLGGVSKYSIMRKDLNHFCRDNPDKIVTTMFDYYALPSGTPGKKDDIPGTIYDKVEYVERKIAEDLEAPNLIPNLLMHEFEALLFSKPECFSYCGLSRRELQHLAEIRASFPTPEHINNSYDTAPSKRIQAIYSKYVKPVDGVNIAMDIGLDRICGECAHFAQWIQKLRDLA